MSQFYDSQVRKLGAVLLGLTLFVFASGCKKHPPPPPPPPVTRNDTTTPASSARPAINNFTAEPTRIERGQSATLRWSISNATDMSIDQGLGAVQSQGQRAVRPNATTTYTLIANGPSGSDTRSVTVEVSTAPAPPPPSSSNNDPTLGASEMLAREGQDAYFDYDKSDIRSDARDALTTDADLLKRVFARDPGVTVTVEGHCDERGSAEYNTALGDRRASAAKDFLTQLGVSGDRLRTVSYGKEKPQCTDATEACYQKNRRAHLSAGQ